MTSPGERHRHGIEQHWQTLLLGLMAAALSFAAKALWEANALQAAQVAELKALSAQVYRLEGSVTTMQANFVTRAEFAVHEQRLQSIERERGVPR